MWVAIGGIIYQPREAEMPPFSIEGCPSNSTMDNHTYFGAPTMATTTTWHYEEQDERYYNFFLIAKNLRYFTFYLFF